MSATLSRLETLNRVRDYLDSLMNSGNFLSAEVQVEYHDQLQRLEAVGLQTNEFRIKHRMIDRDGEISTYFFGPLQERVLRAIDRVVDLEVKAGDQRTEHSEISRIRTNEVFVVHGQDANAIETIFSLLEAVRLVPRVFADARRLTEDPAPYIGAVLTTAFKSYQAILVLFTPDECVDLSGRLTQDGRAERIGYQPRPNVLVEAGIALHSHPTRTVFLEMGTLRNVSDLAGRHVVRWSSDTAHGRAELLDRLTDCGCNPDRSGSRWLDVGRNDSATWL